MQSTSLSPRIFLVPSASPLLYSTSYTHQLLQLHLHSYQRKGGDTENSFTNEFNPQRVRPRNWSPAASYFIYLSLVPPIFHPARLQIEAMEGETVQPLAAKVAAPFLAECYPILLTFTPNISNSALFFSITFINMLEYLLYW